MARTVELMSERRIKSAIMECEVVLAVANRLFPVAAAAPAAGAPPKTNKNRPCVSDGILGRTVPQHGVLAKLGPHDAATASW